MLILEQIRCPMCNKRLIDMSGTAQIVCPKCKSFVLISTEERKVCVAKRPK